MGQGQSSNKKVDISQYPPDIQKLHKEAEELRGKIEMLKEEGKAQKKKQKKELKAFIKEKMELHVTLMKLGKHAQRHFSFWEYVRIVRTTFNSTSAPLAIQGSSSLSLRKEDPKKEDNKPKTTAIVKQSDVVHYTIFAFYEAYLLKKLHIAMMLKTQKKLHAKGWNDLVMFLYYEIPKVESEFETAEARLMNQKNEDEGRKSHNEKCYRAHIVNQQRLIDALKDGVEGKVRKAPNPRSSDESTGSSGSFQQKKVRPSMFGATQTDSYQAPWMKSSRKKIAMSAQKAHGTEETNAQTPKFESSLKNLMEQSAKEKEPLADAAEATAVEEPSEEKDPVADDKPSSDDTPDATEAKPVEEPSEEKEPVADDKHSSNEDSPDATETTTKSTVDKEGEPEEKQSKKEMQSLPKGMPETLEIVTSDDESIVEGSTHVKKNKKTKKSKMEESEHTKKKKKKKKPNLEESEHTKKKKKKKKPASSNSSVVSDLSYGS